eukprot:15479740-Alexandrium_andersonii.AAC.1
MFENAACCTGHLDYEAHGSCHMPLTRHHIYCEYRCEAGAGKEGRLEQGRGTRHGTHRHACLLRNQALDPVTGTTKQAAGRATSNVAINESPCFTNALKRTSKSCPGLGALPQSSTTT